ncbi:MAG: hypothetical protein H7263_01735 [Candidatus Sericytochromatia bacterium]|nr:hypothetical protein [Candidatus Sericytochromatia bacterium]
MPQIGNNQPVQYVPKSLGTSSSQRATSQAPANNNSNPMTASMPSSGQDVYTGKYESFKSLYSNFDANVSKYSPFFGKMGSSQGSGQSDGQNINPQMSGQSGSFTPPMSNTGNTSNSSGDLPIPASAMSGNSTGNTANSSDLPIPQSALQVPASLGANNNQEPNTPASQPSNTQTLPTGQQNSPVIPKKNPPSGPVMNNIQQQLQAETQKISTPQKAVEVVAGHAMLARQERTMANDIAWGARYYANQAGDLAQKLNQNKRSMSPGQIQSQMRTIENYKIKSISLLNDAKKKAINNYNEALKATMLYNNYFTENGQYSSVISSNDRQFVESEIDKTWTTWQGGFDKGGQHAEESPNVVDNAAREIAIALDKVEKLSASTLAP